MPCRNAGHQQKDDARLRVRLPGDRRSHELRRSDEVSCASSTDVSIDYKQIQIFTCFTFNLRKRSGGDFC